MLRRLSVVLFLMSSYANAATVELDAVDSRMLSRVLNLPTTQTENVVENGNSFVLITKAYETADKLLSFSCKLRNAGGEIIKTDCRVTIDENALVAEENQLRQGVSGLSRASIKEKKDIVKLKRIVFQSSQCLTPSRYRLFSSSEKREVQIAGQSRVLPLVTIRCSGRSASGLSKVEVDVLPRSLF